MVRGAQRPEAPSPCVDRYSCHADFSDNSDCIRGDLHAGGQDGQAIVLRVRHHSDYRDGKSRSEAERNLCICHGQESYRGIRRCHPGCSEWEQWHLPVQVHGGGDEIVDCWRLQCQRFMVGDD